MRHLRLHPLDVLLALAVVNLVTYIKWRDSLDAASAWFDLWPNFVVDLFSVWLVSRIVEAYLASREERRKVALQVRASMNFTMQRANDLLPEPYTAVIRALRDESGWMVVNAERRDLLLNESLRKILRSGAQRLDNVCAGADALRKALVDVAQTRNTLDEAFEAAHKADRDHPGRWDLESLDRLSRVWRLSRVLEPQRAAAEVRDAVEAVRHEMSERRLASPVAQVLDAHLAAIARASGLRNAAVEAVGLYTKFVRGSEDVILREAADAR